jgi:hypothetical protein
MLIALRFMLALVLRAMRGFPICCRSLLWLKKAGAWSSSWGHPLGVRWHLEFDTLSCGWVCAPAAGALGSDTISPVRFLVALGLPLALPVPCGQDGMAGPPDGVPELFVAAPSPTRRILIRVLGCCCSSTVTAVVKATAAGGVSLRIAGARPPVAPAPAGFIVVACSLRALTRRMRQVP